MDTKELLKKVRKIEIKTRRLSDAIFGGEYHSAFKGRGMTFAEVRPYQYGDDIRNIDWNVTARYNEAYVKVFEEERELTLMLMVDVSASGLFGSLRQFKNELSVEIAATLAFSALQNNDKTGLILFTDKVELFIPPKKGKSHILRIIRELIEFQPQGKGTDVALALNFLSSVMKKKSIVFLLSDFVTDAYQKPLQIVAKKHDLTGVRLYDEREETLPNVGIIPVENVETGGKMYLDTSSKQVRDAYQKKYRDHILAFENAFRRAGAGMLSCGCHENYTTKLLSYFKRRG